MSEQLEERVIFLKAMENLEKDLTTDGTKEWKLKNGKVVELYKHPQYLDNEIVGTLCSFRDITQRKALEEQLLYQSTHDALTGLPNRILLIDRTQQAIRYAKRYQLMAGFLLLDVDNFKQVNDTFGHKVGDSLLKAVASRLKSSVRENDTVTRFGGDEFVVVIDAQNEIQNLELIAGKLQKALSKPFIIDDREIVASVSIGVSVYPKDADNYDDLLKYADIALYHAKEVGRDNYQLYQPEFNENSIERVELETSLRHALENNEFFLQYQPLINLVSHKVIGMEALVRWQHPTLGTMLPDLFIPLAEKTGSMISIGEWVLRTACAQNKIWNDSGHEGLRVAVNISKVQFEQSNFIDLVRTILKETGLSPSCLELEITESMITNNMSEFFEKMRDLKEIGVFLSIDDFGTGYSNLSYLRYFPFDKVKIDKAFIDEINREDSNQCIVEAIINMSRKMGLEVLAEGVENKEQIQYLRNHHSDQVQGHYFSEPLDVISCKKILSEGPLKQDLIPESPHPFTKMDAALIPSTLKQQEG